MPKDNEKQRIFSRRAVILGGLQVAGFAALASRLYYLQFIKSAEYAVLSENNRIKLQLMTPERGLLLDRMGVAMATNEKNYRVFLDYSGLTQQTFRTTLEKLDALVGIPAKKMKQLERTKVSSASMPEMLKEHLTWEEVSLIELHMLELPGLYIDIGQIRHYPFLDKAAHLLGYVSAVAKEDLSEGDPPLMRLPDFKIGKNGVEKMLEDELRGSAGIRQIEVNVHGVPVREIGKKPSVPGQSVTLTIDSRVQTLAADLVAGQSAAVVAMEIKNGNILCLASMPAFDPNVFSTGISSDYWKTLSTDKKAPLLNKAITGQYPPGSTFKMLVGMAGLEAGAITESTRVHCPGHFMLGDHQFNCWKEGGHGSVNYHDAVKGSCDVFFYTVAQKIGIDKYADMARRFGLGQTYGLGMEGEKPGIIPDPDWKLAKYKQRWAAGDTINCAIGQGYVLSTPLQLAVMTARMASGMEVVPRLWVSSEDAVVPEFKPLDVDRDILEQTQEAMNAVVNGGGTAAGSRIADPRFAMAGKTGTSQVRKIVQRGVNQATIPWEARHHALFVAFAPVAAPKYAIAVVVEHGGGGASAAAPIARDVLQKIQELDEKPTAS
ncbi:MAG: penicillin-binding protein 2 [Alphaproteobacteria bacterium]|nr:penicillin-binding protein 2 [Alphaproteobacteria bacterium]